LRSQDIRTYKRACVGNVQVATFSKVTITDTKGAWHQPCAFSHSPLRNQFELLRQLRVI